MSDIYINPLIFTKIKNKLVADIIYQVATIDNQTLNDDFKIDLEVLIDENLIFIANNLKEFIIKH